MSRLCAGGSESDDDSEGLASGEERASARGDRLGASMVEVGRWGLGDTELRFNVACAGLGLVCGRFRDVIVVFADEVREKGGAIARPGVLGMLASFLGSGESFREDKADDTRGPPPPEPVLLIISPAFSDVLPGTGEGAADPFDAPTFLICALTCRSCRS